MTDKRLCRKAGPVVSNYSLDSTDSVYLLRIHADTCARMQMCTFMTRSSIRTGVPECERCILCVCVYVCAVRGR